MERQRQNRRYSIRKARISMKLAINVRRPGSCANPSRRFPALMLGKANPKLSTSCVYLRRFAFTSANGTVSGIRSVGGHRTDLAFLDAILDDRLRDALRNGLVLLEDHREASAALGDRADGVGVAEHLAQRNRRLEELDSGTVLHPFDASAALVDGAAGGAQ